MSIFPDDDKRRSADADTNDARTQNYPPPKPNPETAFRGGAIHKNGTRKVRASGGVSIAGCLIVVVIVGAVVVPVFLFVVAPMLGFFNVFGEDTRAVPGSETAFDPIASYAEILAYAQGDAPEISFIEMDANFVKRDGTLDLTAESYRASVSWTFIIPAARPENAPPVGAGGSPDDRYFQEVEIDASRPGQMRTVTQFSGGSSTQYTYRHLGLSREVDAPSIRRPDSAPAPVCSFKTLWDVAVERGAPPEAVATINYSGGSYSFRIRDTDVRLEFDSECREI